MRRVAVRAAARALAARAPAVLAAPVQARAISSLVRTSTAARVRVSRIGSSAVVRSSTARGLTIHTEVIPALGDSITEGTLSSWAKQTGEYVERDELLGIIDTDKVSVDLRASASGTLHKQVAPTGATLKVGAPYAELDTDGKPSGGDKKPEAAAAKPAEKSDKKSEMPEAVKPASEKAPAAAPQTKPASSPAPSSSPSSSSSKPAASSKPAEKKGTPAPVVIRTGERTSHREKLTRMRSTIAKRLKDSQNTAAMLTTFNEIDMSSIMAVREKYKDGFEKKHSVKLGFMSVFVKAAANALLRYPTVNATFDGEKGEIEYHDYVDIGVAVATPTGLVVPNLRSVEQMSFRDIEASIAAYGAKARENKIAMEDMSGGTFTISNGGVFGSLFGTPILNPPQSAILGMHAINKKAWVVAGDKIEVRPIMVVALTYDHRIIDGSTAVQFLKDIKLQVEDPARMLLDF